MAETAGYNQSLPFDNIVNLRDLGGLPAANGRTIQSGRLYRSANPGLASAADITHLKMLELDVVVDFRAPGERSSSEAAFAAAFSWRQEPVLVGNLSPAQLLPTLKNFSLNDASTMMSGIYRAFPLDYQAQFKALLTLAEQNRTMLYHCTAGKDRTGFATALLLSALGVERELIVENYLASNLWCAVVSPEMAARIAEAGLDPAVLGCLLSVREDYLDTAFSIIERQYGGMERYLRETLKVDVEALRRNYLV
ncbi:tyrosine-protein phosphatase [Paraburkholderia bonniea]|uniref:tyrosine-protein phosphatase n=1 Tax=Paraburkholderia bonniea TaxID=2152891 RepID=UPI001FE9F892|nr:tyrosine-protein phosphatase [Paraburkholderia bonniea]WJF90754.1 tyrosine-protein phosphatase [Paraburkholderia bonniea]WJF94068.1 tyrosine-protein phosphatase [Paraburkholderia bonniea]